MSITYFTGGYAQAPVQTLTMPKGQSFAYRALGAPGSVPIVALVHLAANLDNWDPPPIARSSSSRAPNHCGRLCGCR